MIQTGSYIIVTQTLVHLGMIQTRGKRSLGFEQKNFDQSSSESDKGYVGYNSGCKLRHVMDDKSSDDNIVVL